MNEYALLLAALKKAIRGQQEDWNGVCAPEDWQPLFAAARAHRVQALVLEAVYESPDFIHMEKALQAVWRQEARKICAVQVARDETFGAVYAAMRKAGLRPLVVKGSVCRSLYPDPGLRPSADEDLLVPASEFPAALRLLQELGGKTAAPQADPETEFEIGITMPDGLYLELHRSLFSPDSAAMEAVCRSFEGVHDRAVLVQTQAGEMLSLSAPDHMLYLLVHAYKHFIHSGVGIRQLCDILLWAEKYGLQIPWPVLWRQCGEARCLKFAQTLFAAAGALGFDAEKAGMGQIPSDLPVDALLEDVLQAGIYGSSSGSRVHSATVTLHAVEADRRGQDASLLGSLFPPRKALEGRYPYLRSYPFLLPLAWCSRFGRYALETAKQKGENSPGQSLSLGKRRKELLRQLDIID